MSDLQEIQLDKEQKPSNPSTSQSTNLQTIPSGSSNNNINDIRTDLKEMPASSSSAPNSQIEDQIEKTSSVVQTNVTDMSEIIQNININSDANSIQNNSTNGSKKRNARKKERLKKLQILLPNESNQEIKPETIQTAPPVPTQNGINSLQNFFLKQVAPLYANTSSSYLENLAHHPQVHLMQTMQLREMFLHYQFASSAPNTPLMQQAHGSNSHNFVNPAFAYQHPPKYFQNAMQHPILSKTFVNSNYNMHQHETNSPRRQRNQKRQDNKDNDDKKFNPYISLEEVELGLQNNTLLEGVLRINPKQFQHAYVSSTDRSEQDVLIDGIKNRNRALEGDVVIVQYIDNENEENTDSNEENKQKRGKVVFIKEKVHTRSCIGKLKLMPDKNRQRALFVPRDYRIPRLNITFTNWPDNFYRDSKSYENTLFSAKIIDWFDVRFALGKIDCNIGESGDMQTETKAILAQTDLDITPFGPEVRHLYPRLDYTIPEEENNIRENCRKLCIFSIDPSNCRDIDDAVSCRKLDNDNFEIGVHISDVAHFLTENTILDEKVAEKATTIYLVEKAYHMLPDDMCMLCSLFPGVDKLAFSVFWEVTESGIVISHRFAKTIIHSCCQLSYEHAQAVLEGKENAEENFPEIYNGFSYQDVSETIKILGKLSAIFRKNRFEGGALSIDQPKVSFHLSPINGLPDSFCIYQSKESHQLIEEFMLLANMTVAKRIYDDHPKLAVLRCHPTPSIYMLKKFAKSLKPMGIDLDISSAGDLHRSLLSYVGPAEERGKAMVLNMLCAKPMTRAKYFCAGGQGEEDFHHYALNVPLYTHFTSPIRRYADIMVHRLLAASLNYRDVPKWDVDKISMATAQCNKQKYNAKKAGELSTELYTLKYIELNSPLVTEAVVAEVKEKYIDVIIVAMGLNRRIFFNNDFPGEYKCIKNDAGIKLSKMELTWNAVEDSPAITQVIEVFSILQVEMHKGDDMVKVETKLVKPK
ncbi:DIS3-like exonuclease 2 [Nymphalis io]|uniref:DIS3-like exonuclease 2 n=1 Tax=Inachis io TaxID=171585 RepID=UPI002168A243|nr:DIS3-like exonuclease 2 [Nymphalis io]